MMSQQTNIVNSIISPDGYVFCKCGVRARRLVSHTPANPKRVFWKCDGCSFFKWGDELPRHIDSDSADSPWSDAPRSVPVTPSRHPRELVQHSPQVVPNLKRERSPSPRTPNKRLETREERIEIIRSAMKNARDASEPSSSQTDTLASEPVMVGYSQSPYARSRQSRAALAREALQSLGSFQDVESQLPTPDFSLSSSQASNESFGEAMTPTRGIRLHRGRSLFPEDNNPFAAKFRGGTISVSEIDDIVDALAAQQDPRVPSAEKFARVPRNNGGESSASGSFEPLFGELTKLAEYVGTLERENTELKNRVKAQQKELEREKVLRKKSQAALCNYLELAD